MSQFASEKIDALLDLSHDLGREYRGLAMQGEGCPNQTPANGIGQFLVFYLFVFDLRDDDFGGGCPVHFDFVLNQN